MNHLINTFSKLKNYIYQCIEIFDFSDINRDIELIDSGKYSFMDKIHEQAKNIINKIKGQFTYIVVRRYTIYFTIECHNKLFLVFESLLSIFDDNISSLAYIKKL